jgi:hypothetical protein
VPGIKLPVVHASPVFADPSGRRRRLLRLLGAAAGLIIAISLALITVGLAGGPQAPFISWAHPHRGAAPTASKHPGQSSPPAVVPVQPSPSADPQPSPSASPSPSSSPSASPSESPTATPAPTNPAGNTPPGRAKSPNPHKSGHGR